MTVCCYICLTNISIMPSCRWTDSLNPCHCFQLAILLGQRSYGRYGTKESCDIACRFCYWLLAIEDYPHEFSRPAKHPYPLNYRVVIYIQHIGVGVCVGHAWQEGKELQRVLQRLCTGILMVKNTI
ncbi:hypothetical protein HID58_082546 [Brassica napus]|uniref:Uncharacterized protein n=1 Tax=Brassica napus TaxID=3708 RepID=A0ABQ7YE05_BRANA|nr:hypothetical protein HID58_082546 [Brassica napus]